MNKVLGLAALVLLFSTGAYALEVTFMVGDVSVIRGGVNVSPLKIGTQIMENDQIVTGSKATMTMTYADGSVIKVLENAKLTIGRMSEGSDSAPVCVVKGSVSAKFTKIAKGSDARRSVYTPTTVCAVRGTEFMVNVSDGADSRVDLSEGSLDVHNPYGGEKIEAGQNLEAGIAKAPVKAEGDAGKWKKDRDAALSADANDKGAAFKGYFSDFSARGKRNSSSIDSAGKKVNDVKDGTSLEAARKTIDGLASSVEEDFYLSATAGAAIAAITDKFKEDKSGMHSLFLKLKAESNKVAEQLQRNYEAIQAVRESYKKAKSDILDKQKGESQKIKGSIDLKNVKPKIEKKAPEKE